MNFVLRNPLFQFKTKFATLSSDVSKIPIESSTCLSQTTEKYFKFSFRLVIQWVTPMLGSPCFMLFLEIILILKTTFIHAYIR